MPAKSPEQKKLMAWAYACKKGKTTNCPDNIQKIANSMTDKQLKDFFKTEEQLQEFLDLMLPVEEEGSPNAEGGFNLANLNNTPGMGRVLPTIGINSVGSDEFTGSGDRFDNKIAVDDDDDDDDDEETKNKKKRKKRREELKKLAKDKEKDKKNKKKQINMDEPKESINVSINFEQFVNEGILLESEKPHSRLRKIIEKRVTSKRRYTEKYPEITMNSGSIMRAKILEFINNKKVVSEKALKQYFQTLEEELGRTPNWNWIISNKNLVKKFESDGEIKYKLTKKGEIINSRINNLTEAIQIKLDRGVNTKVKDDVEKYFKKNSKDFSQT